MSALPLWAAVAAVLGLPTRRQLADRVVVVEGRLLDRVSATTGRALRVKASTALPAAGSVALIWEVMLRAGAGAGRERQERLVPVRWPATVATVWRAPSRARAFTTLVAGRVAPLPSAPQGLLAWVGEALAGAVERRLVAMVPMGSEAEQAEGVRAAQVAQAAQG